MSGYPYGGNPQYPPPQNQVYPQIYNPSNMPPGQPAPPGYPSGQNPQFPYQPGFAVYPTQAGQMPPAAMSYPGAPPATAPPSYGYGFPQVTPQPGYEPIVEWVPTHPNDAYKLTNRAVVAGYEGHDGSPLWVIRARYEGDIIPGKLAIKHKTAYVPWGGRENSVQNIEVCCARPERIRWIASRDGVVPHNAIVGGNTSAGEPLYVGRVREQGSLTPGKVHPSHKSMYIPFAGNEVAHQVYEILCSI